MQQRSTDGAAASATTATLAQRLLAVGPALRALGGAASPHDADACRCAVSSCLHFARDGRLCGSHGQNVAVLAW